MTTIASLGLQIDSGDAVEAKDNLDQLTDAGKRSEESAGRTGRAWETALGSLQGDTRQIVQELQALNAKQTELAQQMATVGRAVTSASTAFSSAAANMGSFRAEAAQAGKVQEALTTATDAGAQAGRRAAESADEQQARILAVAKASLEASQYVQSLNRATEQSAEVTAQANAVLSDSASRQASINSRAQALIATEERQAEAAKKAAGAHREEGQALEELLGKIDPTVAAMSRLDQMEQKLKGFRTSGALDAETFGEYQAKIDQARTALGGADTALSKTGMTAKATAAALRGVPAQFTDIVVSLQGGQAPLTVLLQQGGQLKDMFGGIGPAVQALGGYVMGLVNPFTVAAAAVGALGLAYYQGSEEQDSFRQSLVTTGNAAGATTAGLAAMARQVSATVGTTGAAAAVLSQLAGTGKIVSSSFEQIAIAALSFEKATGRAASETVAEFAKLADDPVKAVVALNEKYHFLTAAVFSQIHALQEQGDTLGAQQVAEGAYADALTKRAEEIQRNLGYVERAWDSAKGAAKGAWDAFLDIGREETFEDKLRQLEQRANIGAGGLGGGLLSGFEAAQGSRAEIGKEWTAVLQQEVDDQARARAAMFEAEAVERGAKAYQALQKAIESTAPKSEKLKKALDDNRRQVEEARRAGYTITAEQEAALEAQTKAKFKTAAGRSSAVDLSSFNDQKNALDAILAEYKNHQKELEAAQKAGLISQESYAAQRAAIIEQQKAEVTNAYEAEIKALEEAKGRSSTNAQQRIQLDQKIADARAAMVKAQKDADSELAVLAINEQGRLDKQTAATKAYVDQLERQRAALSTAGTRSANAIGLGDRQAGLQRDLDGATDRFNDERAKLLDRRRTAPDKYSEDDYQRDLAILSKAEEEYRDTVVDNYDKISAAQGDWRKGASSAFQNYLDQARDVAGQTRALFTNAFSSMEDAVVNFAMTGKFSFADFTKSVLADIARIATRQAMAGIAGSILGSVVGGYFTPGGTTVSTSGFSEGGFVTNAKGGVYDSPSLSHFSNQVHDTPKFFAFAKGAGVFAEAGPEAIMPLTRTSDGNLGVRAIGGGGGGTTIQISAPVSVNVPDRASEGMELDQQLLQQNMERQMKLAAERAVADSWRPGGVSYRNTQRRS
ncbi:phage tail tape measure protein [Pseudomonas sp. S 311-6]|uniref:phage tail tape measure protein n=1 Tax=Pseudomonas TaxID=286 RepID=UPI0020982FC9|nr:MULTISPECIES: phage tail tape measure protein [Pseudomonas]MCO7566453.1 phage tail tape measure protein [Pseudomonas mosselii]MCO7617481.1 phage tail tape measure protein [Pseudomonas guariconensis]MCO7640759.1 phage tail tape measure protein [Pseudomonas sp. S 311-6]